MSDYPQEIADKVNKIEGVTVEGYFAHGRDGARNVLVLTFDIARDQFAIWEIMSHWQEPRRTRVFGKNSSAAVEAFTELFVRHMGEMYVI